ncbi:hypothetical protein WOLCODRAFT_21953 [Wolfiporia cocos MD-104 SS10]|uniref:Uncharacterized protein n=1 Tax=Wolfiporia cocos (strain MD-104) TaxID=742152 RepID=A0A2H3ITR5_WOLCO|nr:hypothetical protein WOLCODRAFT_21953 [Wolfiporia cocos MD-104 SS10]
MRGKLGWQKFRTLLPGYFPQNAYEGRRLTARVCVPEDYVRMMDEIFDAQYASLEWVHTQAHAPGAGS